MLKPQEENAVVFGLKDYPIWIFVRRELEFGDRFSDGANYAKTQMVFLASLILFRATGSVSMGSRACFLSTFKCRLLFRMPSTLTFFELDDKR